MGLSAVCMPDPYSTTVKYSVIEQNAWQSIKNFLKFSIKTWQFLRLPSSVVNEKKDCRMRK